MAEEEHVLVRLQEHESKLVTLDRATARALSMHFAKYLDVRPDLTSETGETYLLTAHQYVGTIELDGLRIVIIPKTPTNNLFYMLTYAYDLPEFREEHSKIDESEELFEFIVEIFAGQVERLAQQGIFRSYVDRQENEPFLRGRLQMAQQVRRDAVDPGRFWQETADYTADVIENRILKWTLWHLSRAEYRNPRLRPRLRRALTLFSEVSLTPIAEADFDRIVYNRLNRSYQSRINLARLLLQHRSVEGKEGAVAFAAYLFDMNKAFELFVAHYLAAHFAAGRGPDQAIDVAIQKEIWLDASERERVRPDIVLRRNGRPYLVLDTKHKKLQGLPDEGDRREMLEYCNTLHLRLGVLIYSDGSAQANHYLYSGEMVWTLRTQVLALTGSLREFQARCQAFAERFAEMMAQG